MFCFFAGQRKSFEHYRLTEVGVDVIDIDDEHDVGEHDGEYAFDSKG